jgi:hypothetical protein
MTLSPSSQAFGLDPQARLDYGFAQSVDPVTNRPAIWSALSAGDLTYLNSRVLAKCDALDGVADRREIQGQRQHRGRRELLLPVSPATNLARLPGDACSMRVVPIPETT